jgi:DNA mismatch endonuclease (patch repair protein)
MTDTLTKKQRSFCMSRIKSKRTKPELFLKKKLKGFVYQPKTFGNPDFSSYTKREVIFVDGCFWHKCPKHFVKPKSNKSYWIPKLERNVQRSKEVEVTYKIAGWKVKRIWECEI